VSRHPKVGKRWRREKHRPSVKETKEDFYAGVCLASNYSWMVISCSMDAHECSSSTWLVAILRIVSKRFKAMCVWFDNPGSILGCVGRGTIMEE
jgi:hypothetical protein